MREVSRRTARTGVLITMLMVTVLLLALPIMMNSFTLNIHLYGDQEMILEYGEPFADPGAEVLLRATSPFSLEIAMPDAELSVSISEPEDPLGTFTVTYNGSFWFWEASAQRTVCVTDTQAPAIFLEEGPDFFFQPGIQYKEPGYQAIDNYDGDITDKVIRVESEGKITYTVVDSSGNTAFTQRDILAYDPNPPEITLEGDQCCTVRVGTVFQEPGFSAHDTVDGDLTESVIVEGEVNWLTPGTYTISYSVSDSYQNEAMATRIVDVVAAPRPEAQWPTENTIYLTFDDGPGPYTEALLDILDQYQVKATFFVVDSEYRYLMKEIVSRGHSIGIHSVTHDYEEIYASPEAYFEDLYSMQQIIYECTGVVTTLMRFPGGSSNLVSENYCENIMTLLTQAVRDAGFQYFDWNVDSDDSGNAQKTKTVLNNVIAGVQEAGIGMVLQHDIHAYSVEAVEQIIVWGLENGYRFSAVRDTTPGFHHDVMN